MVLLEILTTPASRPELICSTKVSTKVTQSFQSANCFTKIRFHVFYSFSVLKISSEVLPMKWWTTKARFRKTNGKCILNHQRWP